MATKDFKIRHSLTVSENATIEGNLTLGGNTVSRLIDSDEVQSIINSSTVSSFLTDSDNPATIYGVLSGPVSFRAKNDSGSTIFPGTAVYISGISGNTPLVRKANASSAATMPAFGIVSDTANNGSEVQIITFGTLTPVPTDQFTIGSIVYISADSDGALTSTKPTGTSELIQNVGIVTRVHATEGSIKVGGSGRTNDIDNATRAKLDSDSAAIAQLRRDVDSDSLAIQSLSTRVDSIDSDFVLQRQLKSHAIGGSYRFDTSTTAGDPGSGDIRFSIDWTTGVEGSSYNAYVSETDKDGVGIAPLLDQLTVSTNTNKSLIIIYKADEPTTNAKFYVTGQTDNGSYRTLDITYVDRDAWGQISNSDEIFMSISIIGDAGSSNIDSDLAVVAKLRNDVDSDSAAIQTTRTEMDVSFNIVNNGASAYTFSGDGFPSGVDNPTLYLNRGHTYNFRVNASGHPFEIRLSNGGSAYSSGVTNNAAQIGEVKFVVPMDAPETLVYQCTAHSGMVGTIKIGKQGFDSDQIASMILENSSGSGMTDSDLAVVAKLRADVDSDSIKLQTLQTSVDGLSGGGTSSIIVPFAFARVATTSNGSGTGLSWSNWNAGAGTLDFTFTTAQPDTNYVVVTDAETFDDYYVGIASKTVNGFEATLYDGSGVRTPSGASPFTLIVYGSNPNTLISGNTDIGFDSDQIVAIINENSSGGSGVGITDSDLKVVADLRNDVNALQSTGVVSQESTFTTFKYKATQGQSTFSGLDRDNQTLAYTVGNINVYINGILLNDSDDYTATNGTSVVLDLAADSDDVVVIQKMRSSFDSDTILSIWNNNQSNLTISRYDYTATQSQTVFSGADDNGNSLSYIQDKIQVFLNGILLVGTDDYTATNGTSLTLTVAADSDDTLSIIKYLGADAQASYNLNVTRFTYKYGEDGNSIVGDSEITGGDENGNTLSYVVGKIQVYSNGILLEDSDDYIATDGSTITLRAAPDSDDVVSIFKYLGTTQSGFDSEQVVAIVNENSSGVTTGKAIAMAIVFGG